MKKIFILIMLISILKCAGGVKQSDTIQNVDIISGDSIFGDEVNDMFSEEASIPFDIEIEASCTCGDGVCEAVCEENINNCSIDCHVCGNGKCEPGEGPELCPLDCCGICGDQKCATYGKCTENKDNCAEDCAGFACGNKICEKGENPVNCSVDCGKFACGNDVCEPGEDVNSCPSDCGASCGNCICEGGESFETCPLDCGYCGDGYCSPCVGLKENENTCKMDCSSISQSDIQEADAKENFDTDYEIEFAPSLKIVPEEIVDFGYVGQSIKIEREVDLYNTGNADLTITFFNFVEPISSEFKIESFSDVNFTINGGMIPIDGHVKATLSFTNNGPATGEETGTLKILSNSYGKPESILILQAFRTGTPTCNVVFKPTVYNFETIKKGESISVERKLFNNGTGYCSFISAKVDDCVYSMPLAQCPSTPGTSPSNVFSITKTPPTIIDGIGPGSNVAIEVTFTAPETSDGSPEDKYYGLLTAEIFDGYKKVNFTYPSANTPNLIATIGDTK